MVKSHDEAWDCATGNGQAAIGLAEYFSQVEATDISEEQISNAFSSINVNYSVQPGESTTFDDNQFDLVNVAQALHWFDFTKYWDEVARVLKPSGAFAAFSYVWPQIDKELDQILEKYIRKVIEPYWAPNNQLAWEAYRSLELPFKPVAAPNINLENHWNLDQFLDYIQTWSGTRRCMDDIGHDFLNIARKEFETLWGDPKQEKVVKNPLTIIAGVAWS